MIQTAKPAHFNETSAAPPSYTALPTPLPRPPSPSATSINFTTTHTAPSITPFPINASANNGLEPSQAKEDSRLTAEEKPVGVMTHIGQAFLVLLTSPFMILYAVFKLLGTIFKGIGVFFLMLGDWAYALAYKPGKTPSQIVSDDALV